MQFHPIAAGLVASASLVATASVSANLDVYRSGFEAPAFVPGPLAGQDGWDLDVLGTPDVNVSTEDAFTGSQSVRWAGTGGWAYRGVNFDPLTSGLPLVSVTWAMKLSTQGTPSGGWGVDIFDSSFGFITRLQVAGDGTVFAENALEGFVDTGADVARGVWNTYEMRLNFEDDTWQAFVNGQAAGVYNFTPGTGVIADADLRHNNQIEATDFAFFDDYAITASVVPEPAGLSLLGLAAACLPRRRR